MLKFLCSYSLNATGTGSLYTHLISWYIVVNNQIENVFQMEKKHLNDQNVSYGTLQA